MISRAASQRALPPGRSPRDLTPELRAQLFALDGPRQGPEERQTKALPYGFSQGAPQGPQAGGQTSSQRAERDRQNFAREVKQDILNRRNRKGLIAGGGGLGVLAGILGLSNMGNEEEEQMR